jgi:hypothetical protein
MKDEHLRASLPEAAKHTRPGCISGRVVSNQISAQG